MLVVTAVECLEAETFNEYYRGFTTGTNIMPQSRYICDLHENLQWFRFEPMAGKSTENDHFSRAESYCRVNKPGYVSYFFVNYALKIAEPSVHC